jgi:transposase
VSQNGTSILFGVRGVSVREVVPDEAMGRVVHVVTDDPDAAACPACGVVSTAVRQQRTTRPRDLPQGEEPLVVRWHKKQYACKERLCARKAFTEQIAEVPARARVTGRLRRAAGVAVGAGAGGTAVSTVGELFELGWSTVHDAFAVHADAHLDDVPGPVAVLGIDETRRGRPTWSQDPDTAVEQV